MVSVPPDTRAQVARQRLADLAATFDVSPAGPDDPLPDRGRGARVPSRSLRPVHVRLLGVVAGVVAVLTTWWLLAGRPHEIAPPPASPVAISGPSNGATGSTDTASVPLIIDVAGRVRRPGIVTLAPGSRVHEAIDAAGGFKGRVDTVGLNLARVLTDGEQVVVGAPPAAPGAAVGPAAGAPSPTAPVNLNTADSAALDELPGVGPVTAAAIIAWREANGGFAVVEDLLDVKGIGEATLAELRDLVSV